MIPQVSSPNPFKCSPNIKEWNLVPEDSSSIPLLITKQLLNVKRLEDNWIQFDSFVNAASFAFVATTILISMFLVIAMFERFLYPHSSEHRRDMKSQVGFHPKLGYHSPKLRFFWNFFSKSLIYLMFFLNEFILRDWETWLT